MPGQASATDAPLNYPVTAKTNVMDDYHGTKVADPYRWLEDDNSPATKAWVEAENKLTFGFLDKIPERAGIKERLTQIWNYERYGVPSKEGGRYFLTRNDGLQNQSVLYSMTALDAEPAVLLDPNRLSSDGTVALAGTSVSHDGNLLAYGLAQAGSDWEDWKVRDVRTGKDLPDEVHWVKFSGASWTKDNQGFFYSRYAEPKKGEALKGVNYYHKLYYHKIGTPQSDDKLIYERPDQKEWGFAGGVTDDGRYLIIDVTQGTDTRNRVFYRNLAALENPVVELLNQFDASYNFIGNVGTVFYFRTDLSAPRGRVIAIDVKRPERANWKEIIPQSANRLRDVTFVNDQLIADYLKDAHSEIKIFGRDGKLARQVDLPGLGSASGFGGKREDHETFYSYTSYTTPATIYRYDLRAGVSTVFRQPKVRFDPNDYESKQIFCESKDGTRVPMFITYKKGLKLDGSNPTYLYGYGGFDISITPTFSPANAVWMEMGGVFAVANLRGGGEYGEDWHHAGMKLKKQNVFDDFIAAGEWLVANHYTRPDKLAIGGGSNGGLLVGACLTQRPDLFGATLPSVGVMDMLRFQKFTIGWAWTADYGSSDDSTEFKALYAYSPLHNIKPGTKYPATLITTGDHDDRVVPAHSFKFAATLQADQAGPEPILIRIETRAGHGAGKPTTKIIDEAADKWAFLVHELHMNAARAD
ncbi:MAG TPA: prolyl oligopeptidase family serine peptidase [Verrucomicrobiae bacterium]|nr:prolyl oligopeptidase family serine peptidase [Verrucomicrobiae bacterium]